MNWTEDDQGNWHPVDGPRFDRTTTTSAWHDVEQECVEGKWLTVGGLIVAWCLFVGTLAGAIVLWRHR